MPENRKSRNVKIDPDVYDGMMLLAKHHKRTIGDQASICIDELLTKESKRCGFEYTPKFKEFHS